MVDRKKTRRWKTGLLTVGLLLTAVMMTGCKKRGNDTVAEIQKRGTLQVVMVSTGSSRPEESELVTAIAGALGVSAEVNSGTMEEALQAVADGTADIAVSGIARSYALREQYELSEYYAKGYYYAVTPRGSYAATLGALEQKRLGLCAVSQAAAEQLAQIPESTWAEYDAQGTDVVEALNDEMFDAIICGAEYVPDLLTYEEIQVQDLINLEPDEYVVVTNKGNVKLKNGINQIIKTLAAGQTEGA